MLGDMMRNIGGGRLNVIPLMGPGVDPHLYKASEGDVTRLESADIVVYNGLHLEGKMGEILEKMARSKPVISAGDLLDESRLMSPPEFSGHHDPHIWFDLSIWSEVTLRIGAEMARIDTAYAAVYRERSRIYADSVLVLHKDVKAQIATIPSHQRVLITAHDAFGYFGRAYDIEVRGLQGISTVSEYGLRDVTEMVDFIFKRKIKAVFVESSVPVRSIQAVQSGVRQLGHDVVIGGTLYSDALGEVGSSGETYLGMVRHNVTTIVQALK